MPSQDTTRATRGLAGIQAAALAVTVILMTATGPLAAQSYMANSADEVTQVARLFGSAELDLSGSDGRPMVRGQINGTRYGILMYGCEGTFGCDSVQFFASFGTPNNGLDFLNQWNADKRFASAYRNNTGDVILQYNANLDLGISRANFEDTMDIWRLTLGQFVDRLNGLPEGTTSGTAGTTGAPSK